MTPKSKWKQRCRKIGEVRDHDRDLRSIFMSMKEIRCAPCISAKVIVSLVCSSRIAQNGGSTSISKEHQSCREPPSLVATQILISNPESLGTYLMANVRKSMILVLLTYGSCQLENAFGIIIGTCSALFGSPVSSSRVFIQVGCSSQYPSSDPYISPGLLLVRYQTLSSVSLSQSHVSP